MQTNVMVQAAYQSLHWIEHLRAWLFGGVSRAVFNSVNSVVSYFWLQGLGQLTRQTPDTVIYDNTKYALAGLKGTGLLKPTDLGITPCIMATFCYRGYICQYELIDENLYLKNMKVRTMENQYPIVGAVSPTLSLGIVGHYEDLNLFCKFSGGLILVRDALPRIRSVTPNPPSFSTVIEMILNDGNLEQLIDHSKKMDELRSQIDNVPDSSNKWNIISKIEWSFVSGYEKQPAMFINS